MPCLQQPCGAWHCLAVAATCLALCNSLLPCGTKADSVPYDFQDPPLAHWVDKLARLLVCASHKHELGHSQIEDLHVDMCCNVGAGPGSKSPCSWLTPSPQGGAHVVHMEDLAVNIQPPALTGALAATDPDVADDIMINCNYCPYVCRASMGQAGLTGHSSSTIESARQGQIHRAMLAILPSAQALMSSQRLPVYCPMIGSTACCHEHIHCNT